MKKALGKLSIISDALFGRLVPSETLVIRTNNLATILKKVAVNDVKELAMEEGPTKFKLPANLGDIGGGDINAQVNRLVFYASVQFIPALAPNLPMYTSLLWLLLTTFSLRSLLAVSKSCILAPYLLRLGNNLFAGQQNSRLSADKHGQRTKLDPVKLRE